MLRLPPDLEEQLRSKGTLIVPSRPRARTVQLAFAARQLQEGRRVWESPDVLTPSAWMTRECERAAPAASAPPRLLSPTEEWYLWRSCTLEATADLRLLDRAACATQLQHAAALARDWRITYSDVKAGEAALLAQVGEAVRARCRELRCAPATELIETLPRPVARVRLAGFATVPPRLAQLTGSETSRPARRAPPGLLVVADRDEEAARISAWCAAQLHARPEARLLVQLPGDAGRRARLAARIRQELDPRGSIEGSQAAADWVRLEDAGTLSGAPAIAHALTTLRFLAGEELDLHTVSAWLCSPYLAVPPAAARARLALALKSAGIFALRLPELLGALQRMPEVLGSAARELAACLTRARAALPEARSGARTWAERVGAALSASGWPGAADAQGEQTRLQLAWHELLESFGELGIVAGRLERAQALELLQELAGHTPQRAPEVDASVTIAAALFDPVVGYDALWVGGLECRAFPLPLAPEAFLPLGSQLQAQLPGASAATRLSESRYLVEAWQRSSEVLVLSAPLREKDLQLEASPLFAPQRPGAPDPSRWLPVRLRREGQQERLVDERGLPWRTLKPLPRGSRSVELQNQCPFRAYAELRLGGARPERIEPGIPAHRRGILLHAALQYLWEDLKDSAGLAARTDVELGVLIAECVARARNEFLTPPPPGKRRRRGGDGQQDLFLTVPPLLARECARAERLIARLCALERTRAPFSVPHPERNAELVLAGTSLRLQIDRVDALAAGGYAILDYKTGQRRPGDWLGDRPAHTQLLVYSCALALDVAALATVSVHARPPRFDGIAREAGLLPHVDAIPGEDAQAAWQAQRARWRALVEQLMGDFLEGDARLDPREDACNGCHIRDVCRIDEIRPRRIAAVEEA